MKIVISHWRLGTPKNISNRYLKQLWFNLAMRYRTDKQSVAD
jgi:hypothetical protein